MPTLRRLRIATALAAVAAAAFGVLPTATAASPLPADIGGGFQVGAAVVSYAPPCGPDGTKAANNCTPPARDFVDPADCVATARNVVPAGTPLDSFNGKRLFAFEEPYADQQGSGHYDLGDPYVDCNGDGRWDGNFIGGGSDAPRYYDYVADPPGARAMVVSNGTRTIAVEVLDNEGAFDVYLAAIRSLAATQLSSDLSAGDIFISSTHDESAPDSIGLYGVTPATSSANPYWINYMEQRSALAIEQAAGKLQPASITYAEAIQPATFRQCWSSYPFVDDQLVPSLRAVSTETGKTIVTLADVSQHAETLGFNGGAQVDPGSPNGATLDQEKDWLTADWPFWFRKSMEANGGVGIEMAGSVGSVETPQVFAGPLSRTPEKFQDGGHPAGCRTEFNGNGSPVPLGYYSEDVALGGQLGDAVEAALANGTTSQTTVLDGSRSNVCILDTNGLFAVAGAAGVFGGRPGYVDPNCTVSAPLPPSGNTGAAYIQTQVAAFRIGDGTFVSIPGEVFPFTYLRGFLGPDDMPCPQPSGGDPTNATGCQGPPSPTLSCAQGNPYQLPPWLMPHMHTPYRFIDGLGEDMVGYIFPCGNGIGVPGEYPENPTGNGSDRFGCGHSDDSEAASSDSGDLLGNAAVGLLDNLAVPSAQPTEDIETGQYVLGDGTLSRSPLGTPGSIQCDVNATFDASHGPAKAIELTNGTIVHPASWMSLSGGAQADGPDRNTRGWIDASGTRHWLDVFDGATPPPPVLPEAPLPVLLVVIAGAAFGIAYWVRRRRNRGTDSGES